MYQAHHQRYYAPVSQALMLPHHLCRTPITAHQPISEISPAPSMHQTTAKFPLIEPPTKQTIETTLVYPRIPVTPFKHFVDPPMNFTQLLFNWFDKVQPPEDLLLPTRQAKHKSKPPQSLLWRPPGPWAFLLSHSRVLTTITDGLENDCRLYPFG